MRGSYSGNTSAFQADAESSILLPRSKETMKFETFKSDVSFLIVRDLYDSNELSLIKKELNFLHAARAFRRDTETLQGALHGVTGEHLKKASGVWIDHVYSNRDTSVILKINRKLFNHQDIVKNFIDLNPYHLHYWKCNGDMTLLHYYENADYYKSHTDRAVFTAVTWFFEEPKKFKGGNFKFTDLNKTIEIENNMCVIFPSFLFHEVDEITMDNIDENIPNGRFSMTQFLVYA